MGAIRTDASSPLIALVPEETNNLIESPLHPVSDYACHFPYVPKFPTYREDTPGLLSFYLSLSTPYGKDKGAICRTSQLQWMTIGIKRELLRKNFTH
jgi:hypothetical protein